MDTLSWFKFCPAKWNMGKTRKLTPEQRDEYLDLCSSYWVGGCVMTLEDMRTHSDYIDLFLRRGLVSEDGIEWLNVQYEQVASKSSKARQAAKKRWSESERNADAMRTHSDSTASAMQIEREKEREIDREERESKRANAYPPDLGFENEDSSNEDSSQATDCTQEKEKVAPKRKRFVKPTEIEVQVFFQTTNLPDEWEAFYDYYQSNGWKAGKNPMRDWHAAARNWVRRQEKYNQEKQNSNPKTNGKPFADLTPERLVGSIERHLEKKRQNRANGHR